MVREGLDGLWAWGSVTEASQLLQNIHPETVVTYRGALMKTSGSEAKVGAAGDMCSLRWGVNKPSSSGLAPQVHLNVWIGLHSGWASPADLTDTSHTLRSYLHRCPSHRRTLSPWTYRSPLLSSPAGRRSASRSCPECICRSHCTSQGIPLQGKQPHVQTYHRGREM